MTPDECPTCGNGMAVVRAGVGWCRRCGTVRYVAHPDAKETLVAVPKLVERCRKFHDLLSVRFTSGDYINAEATFREWEANGLAESIHPPGDRP